VPEEPELPEPELPLDDALLPEEEEDGVPEDEEDELPDDVLLAVDASPAPPEPDTPDPPDPPDAPEGAWEPVVDPQAAQSATQRTATTAQSSARTRFRRRSESRATAALPSVASTPRP